MFARWWYGTFSAGIGLHELAITSAGLFKLSWQPCELWQNLVDNPDVGGQVIVVEVSSQEPADIAQAADDKHRRLTAAVSRHGFLWDSGMQLLATQGKRTKRKHTTTNERGYDGVSRRAKQERIAVREGLAKIFDK
jgi:hypothetical protein